MMVSPVRLPHGDSSSSSAQQSNNSTKVHQLGLADRLIVNIFDFFRDNILREPNAATVKELYNGLRAKLLNHHQDFAHNAPQEHSSSTNLNVLAKNPDAVSKELRIRTMLTFARNENFFATAHNQNVMLSSSQVGTSEEELEVEDVPDKIKMVKRLYESIDTNKYKKKSKHN